MCREDISLTVTLSYVKMYAGDTMGSWVAVADREISGSQDMAVSAHVLSKIGAKRWILPHPTDALTQHNPAFHMGHRNVQLARAAAEWPTISSRLCNTRQGSCPRMAAQPHGSLGRAPPGTVSAPRSYLRRARRAGSALGRPAVRRGEQGESAGCMPVVDKLQFCY